MRHCRRYGVLVAALDAVWTRLRARMQVLNEEGTEICMEALLLLRSYDGVSRDFLLLALVSRWRTLTSLQERGALFTAGIRWNGLPGRG